jgi:hypothetical protein
MRDLGTPLAPTFGGGKKKKKSERLMERSKKVLHKANVALDEGRMKKEKRLFDRSERLKARAKKKGY